MANTLELEQKLTTGDLDKKFSIVIEKRAKYDECQLDFEVLHTEEAWKKLLQAESIYKNVRNNYYNSCEVFFQQK